MTMHAVYTTQEYEDLRAILAYYVQEKADWKLAVTDRRCALANRILNTRDPDSEPIPECPSCGNDMAMDGTPNCECAGNPLDSEDHTD